MAAMLPFKFLYNINGLSGVPLSRLWFPTPLIKHKPLGFTRSQPFICIVQWNACVLNFTPSPPVLEKATLLQRGISADCDICVYYPKDSYWTQFQLLHH